MAGIPPTLRRQLRKTLLDCGPFASNDDLQDVFVDERINPWADGLPQRNSKERRVDAIINYLVKEARDDTGQNVLVLFVHVIRDGTAPQRACYRRLSDLATALGAALQDDTDSPDRPTKTPSQTPPTESKPPPAVQATSTKHDPPPPPSEKPSNPLARRNGEPVPPAKSLDDDAPEKNLFDVVLQHAGKLRSSLFGLTVLGVWSGIVTVLYLTEIERLILTLIIIFILSMSAIFAFVWNSAERAKPIRFVDGLLVVLMIIVAILWGLPPNVDNSCPNVTLTVFPDQIKPSETAELTVNADDLEKDALNYTWEATIPKLEKEGGPHGSAQNKYTASAEAAGEKVTITVHVDDNQCGKQVSEEVTIPILLPDN